MGQFRIGVIGAAGRMGQMLVREVVGTAGASLSGGTEQPGSPHLGRDIGEVAGLAPLQIKLGADPAALFAASDAVIDFSAPAATVAHAGLAAQAQAVLVAGTTGLSPDQEEQIVKASHHTAIVRAANMSLGINLLMVLVERGRVALDTAVVRYVPEFNSPGTGGITVRHLLTHTSGLRGTLPLKDAPDSATALSMVLTTVPIAPPGSRMVYSDLNAILLGEIVHRALVRPLGR